MIIVVTILAILIGALIFLPWWTKSWEKTLVHLKREPETVGAVLSYICDSTRLMAMFQGHSFQSLKELKSFLNSSEKRFRIGKFIGDDGELYYGIEVEDETQWVENIDEMGERDQEVQEGGEMRSLESLQAAEGRGSSDREITLQYPSNNPDAQSST